MSGSLRLGSRTRNTIGPRAAAAKSLRADDLALLEHRDLAGMVDVVLHHPVELDVARRGPRIGRLIELVLGERAQRAHQPTVGLLEPRPRLLPRLLAAPLDRRPVLVVRDLPHHFPLDA